MGSRKMLVTTAMVALVALPLAACSSSMLLSSAGMCQAHGGVYITALDMAEMAGDK